MIEAIGIHRLMYMSLIVLLETVADYLCCKEVEEVYAADDYE